MSGSTAPTCHWKPRRTGHGPWGRMCFPGGRRPDSRWNTSPVQWESPAFERARSSPKPKSFTEVAMHTPPRVFLRSIISTALTVALFAPPAWAQRRAEITLATTTSTQDTGLLDSLLPMFKRETGIDVKAIAVGTGAALEMGRRGDADAVLVHAPEAEAAYVQSGDLIGGRLIMHNDFLILGPAGDPAHIQGTRSLPAQMRAIAAAGSFVS